MNDSRRNVVMEHESWNIVWSSIGMEHVSWNIVGFSIVCEFLPSFYYKLKHSGKPVVFVGYIVVWRSKKVPALGDVVIILHWRKQETIFRTRNFDVPMCLSTALLICPWSPMMNSHWQHIKTAWQRQSSPSIFCSTKTDTSIHLYIEESMPAVKMLVKCNLLYSSTYNSVRYT